MMSCDSFRKQFEPGTEDGSLLAHLRTCDRCLDFAAHADPEVMFRALGGSAMIPQGGIDAFVSGVMQQVRVRDAETTVEAGPGFAWPRRVAMAAAVAVAAFGATLVYRAPQPSDFQQPVARAAVRDRVLTTKPTVETYQSENATIVEVPTEGADDVKIVMIFDENLPADL